MNLAMSAGATRRALKTPQGLTLAPGLPNIIGSMRLTVVGVVLWLTVPSIASPAETVKGAPKESPVAWAMAVGIATALVPLTVGAALYAEGDSLAAKRAGFYVLEGGLALAPLLSHAVVREWTRGLVLTALPLAAFGGVVTLLELRPRPLNKTDPTGEFVLWSLVSASLLSAMIAVVDSAAAGERARSRLRLAPATGPHHLGLTLEGYW